MPFFHVAAAGTTQQIVKPKQQADGYLITYSGNVFTPSIDGGIYRSMDIRQSRILAMFKMFDPGLLMRHPCPRPSRAMGLARRSYHQRCR
jgi:hypothetical protein